MRVCECDYRNESEWEGVSMSVNVIMDTSVREDVGMNEGKYEYACMNACLCTDCVCDCTPPCIRGAVCVCACRVLWSEPTDGPSKTLRAMDVP